MLDSIALKLLCVAAASATVAAMLIPLASRIATAIGLVDKPDAKRKLHERPIPMIGGIVIFLTTSLVTLLAISRFGHLFSSQIQTLPAFHWEHLGLLSASLILLGVGVLDDFFKIRGSYKLIGQIIAATILIGFGYYFDEIRVSGTQIQFGVFSILIVYFWLLGAVNSVNLLDGADGFAGTLGLVVSIAISVMAVFVGGAKTVDAVIAASLGGALVGFLLFNLPPAKIYLGDAGSMVIGLVLGALAISTSFKEQTFYALVAPIAILSIPILDSTVAIIRRKMTGRGIYAVDRGHIHHNLLSQGLSPKMAVLWMFVLCGTTAAGGVLSFITRESEFAIISIVLVVGFLVAGRIFGFAEFRMIGSKVKGVTNRILPGKAGDRDSQEYQLQGTRDWGKLFGMVRSFAIEHGFRKITLDINAPWIHESYHGTWKSPASGITEAHEEWESTLPLILESQLYGRLIIVAAGDECNAYRCIPELIEAISTTGEEVIRQDPLFPRAKSTAAQPDRNESEPPRMEDSGVLSR